MNSPSFITRAAPARHTSRRSAVGLGAVLSAAALIVAGCGSSSPSTTKTSAPSTHTTVAKKTTHTTTHAATSRTTAAGLSGTWTGQYSGAYSGHFTLHWIQSGSKLTGTIHLSSPQETTGISGSVTGGAIKFGTVSGAVYNGTVSGHSMSGSYSTPAGGGSWSANKG